MADDFGLNVIPADKPQDDIVTEAKLRNQMLRMRDRSIPLVFAPMLIFLTPLSDAIDFSHFRMYY
jgi:hypothetical protein